MPKGKRLSIGMNRSIHQLLEVDDDFMINMIECAVNIQHQCIDPTNYVLLSKAMTLAMSSYQLQLFFITS